MLYGKKIILDYVQEQHLATLLKWRNNPFNRQWYREHRILSLEDQKKWYNDKIVNGDGSWQYFVVRPSNPDLCHTIIGVTGLIYIHPTHKRAEIAFQLCENRPATWIYHEFEYQKDILSTLIKYGFDELNLNKVWIETIGGNPNIDLYTKLGFTLEGTIRESYYKNGIYKNSFIMGLLKSEAYKLDT